MKKKIFVGLLASVLVCFAVVFTNASSNSFRVSGKVMMSIDNDQSLQPVSGATILHYESQVSDKHTIYSSDGDGNFSIPNVTRTSVIKYSYSDDWGSTDVDERQYSEETNNEQVNLHYQSHSFN